MNCEAKVNRAFGHLRNDLLMVGVLFIPLIAAAAPLKVAVFEGAIAAPGTLCANESVALTASVTGPSAPQ